MKCNKLWKVVVGQELIRPSKLVTSCPSGVRCGELTTCPLYIGPVCKTYIWTTFGQFRLVQREVCFCLHNLCSIYWFITAYVLVCFAFTSQIIFKLNQLLRYSKCSISCFKILCRKAGRSVYNYNTFYQTWNTVTKIINFLVLFRTVDTLFAACIRHFGQNHKIIMPIWHTGKHGMCQHMCPLRQHHLFYTFYLCQ